MKQTLNIKNMVCDRCKSTVLRELEELGCDIKTVELGQIVLNKKTGIQTLELEKVLSKHGFEIIKDETEILIEEIKIALIKKIEKSVIELNLGGKKISTEQTDQTEFKENSNQKKLLWSVLAINFTFFIIEITIGIISKSMGLVADSLDMLADSFVYGISLFAVGGTLIKKKRNPKQN